MTLPAATIPSGVTLHLAWVRWWSALAYHALSLAGGMNDLGVACRVVAPPGSPLAIRSRALGIGAPEWNRLGASRPDRFLASVRSLRRAAADGAVAGVFAHTGRGHAAAALGLVGTGAPVLRVRADIRRPASGPLQRWLYTRATDRVLLSGSFMAERHLDGLGLAAKNVAVLPAGIDCGRASGIDRPRARALLRNRAGWPAGALVVGMLARYSPVKGHRELVGAAARILAVRRAGVYFLTAGPAGQLSRQSVAEWAAAAGLEGRFAAWDAVEDPLALAAGLDVAVIASTGSEAVCRSALEYMCLGIPIVASAINVIPETVGGAARLVRPGDPAALAEAIEGLLEDPIGAEALGAEGPRRVAEHFAMERIARAAATIYEEARRERRGRVRP